MAERFDLPRGYLSASALGTLLRCPKQFEFRYIHDITSPPSAALVTGKAAHSTYEEYFTDYLQSNTRMTPKMVAELSVTMLDNELEASEFRLKGSEYDDTISDLQDITGSYVEHVGKNIEPVSVEDEFRYITKCGVELLGFLDLKHRLSVEDSTLADENALIGLIDYKITSKKWNHSKLANSLQFNLYSLATGIEHIAIHNMVKGGKSKKLPTKPSTDVGVTDVTNKLRIIEHKFDNLEHEHFDTMVYQAAQLITAGLFMPCDPESWCCNPTWCGYWDLCRGAARSKALIVDLSSEAAA